MGLETLHMKKLHQITAILKGVKSRVYGEVTTLHKESQKPEAFSGFAKNYRKKNDESEAYEPESKRVQLVATDVLKKLAKLQTELFDSAAEVDWANQKAVGDVVVDGYTVLSQVPVTYLLFLEKQLTDIRTFIDKMPTLDDAKDWSVDPNSNLFKTSPVSTHKTKKVQRPIVLYAAVIKDGQALPAQTQLITEDEIVGWWETVHHSGALPTPRKEVLVERVDKLLRAVKVAREDANDQATESHKIGDAVFGYLLA